MSNDPSTQATAAATPIQAVEGVTFDTADVVAAWWGAVAADDPDRFADTTTDLDHAELQAA